MSRLTGKRRHRVEVLRRSFRPDETVLVLQVEYVNMDTDFSSAQTLWRDATIQDITEENTCPANPPIPANPTAPTI